MSTNCGFQATLSFFSLTVLETRNPNSASQGRSQDIIRAVVPLETLEKNLLLAARSSQGSLVPSSWPHHSRADVLTSPSVLSSHCPLCVKSPSASISKGHLGRHRGPTNQDDFPNSRSLSRSHRQSSFPHIRKHSQVPGIRMSYLCGAIFQQITMA